MKYLYLIIICCTYVLIACEEDASLVIKKNQTFLVVDGMITNTSKDNYVRLCLSDTEKYEFDPYTGNKYRFIPVNNAEVIVFDNIGNRDTLKLKYDGYYPIDSLKGLIGLTYTLYIKYENKEYLATSYMQSVPTIDSVYFGKIYNPTKDEYYYPPLISFKEPPLEDNYYLFRFGFHETDPYYDGYLGSKFLLEISILNDDYLSPLIKGLDVTKGYSSDYWINGYTWTLPGDSVGIRMYSISKEGYKFWETITEQIESEGGIFNPTPSTPVGNISGGALGLFQASAVSSIKGRVPLDMK